MCCSPLGCKESGTTERLGTEHIYTFFFLIGFFLFVCLFVFVIELHEVLVYFGDELFVSSFICKYFLPFCVLSSHFVHGFLCPGKGMHLLCGFVSKKDL